MPPAVLKPPKLEKGQSVGVIAPAGPVSEGDLQSGIARLEAAGYRILLSTHLYDSTGYLAGEDAHRLSDLHDMFRNPEIGAVVCARGGYGTMRLLDRIDYGIIKDHPKILVGYSDITALHMAFQAKTGLVTFHGPMVKDLATKDIQNINDLLDLFSAGEPWEMDLTGAAVIVPGRITGPLLGGNLRIITHLIGTPYMPRPDGAILVIEEQNEPLYRIDRMLTHLKISNHLEGLSGVLAGTFLGCGDAQALDRLLRGVFEELEIPVMTGLPIGHGSLNRTLPMGIPVTLDTDRPVLSLKESSLFS